MNKENKTTPINRQPCIVKIYRGIPIKNNDYKQYINENQTQLDMIRTNLINQTFRRNSPNSI
jgi:hypothetical protein